MVDYNVWLQWHFHPDIVIGVFLLQGGYLLGVTKLRSKYNLAPAVDKRKTVFFSVGVASLYLALSSPIHHLADNYLFSAHMIQHLILLLVVPPLLLTGTPGWLCRPIIRYRLTAYIANWLTRPVQAFAISGLVLGLWHLPQFYNATLTNHSLHVIEHVMFSLSAIIMWWPVLSPINEVPRASYPMQMVYLFLLTLPAGFIGAAITFSPRILYDFYATVPRLWSIDAVTDQQIGGLIMKIPGALAFFITMIFVFALWYQRDQRGEFSPINEIEPPDGDE
ncbi:MAG: putative membrane protein [Chloroflexi bacterium]|nr:MAG: putative membrane protein [Chloroflexota bacterium]